MTSGLNHVQRVRYLYKTILRLHRGLPDDLHSLGNSYVRDEFRRHKNCNPPEAASFMMEWTVKDTVTTGAGASKVYIPKLWYYEYFMFVSEKEVITQEGRHTEDFNTQDNEHQYAVLLADQLGLKGPKFGSRLGSHLENSTLEAMRGDQIQQLYDLLQAVKGEIEEDKT